MDELEMKETIETNKVITEGERVAEFVGSDAWKTIRKSIIHRVIDLDTIAGLDVTSPMLGMELSARQMAKEMLMDFLTEIEGKANQYKAHAEVLSEMKEEEILQRFE